MTFAWKLCWVRSTTPSPGVYKQFIDTQAHDRAIIVKRYFMICKKDGHLVNYYFFYDMTNRNELFLQYSLSGYILFFQIKTELRMETNWKEFIALVKIWTSIYNVVWDKTIKCVMTASRGIKCSPILSRKWQKGGKKLRLLPKCA